MFFSKFAVKKIEKKKITGKWKLEATVSGEPIVPEKGETVVKAVTNYGFRFEKTDNGYQVRISVDI